MEIKAVSFNIRCCSDPNGNSIQERAPRLHSVLSKYDADVIGFQEYRPEWTTYINEYFGKEYGIFNQYRAKEELESSPILWKKDKFDCVKTGYFWLSDTPETESRGWDEVYNCYRMCVYAILKEKETGKEFTFMNTHFGFGDKCQVGSANLIESYSKKISPYPTFVVGDFNMNPETVGYAAMTKSFTDVNAVTAKDYRDTYHAYHPEEVKNTHIDYCFVDKSVVPVYQKIIDDLVENKFPSDHYGLYIELKI